MSPTHPCCQFLDAFVAHPRSNASKFALRTRMTTTSVHTMNLPQRSLRSRLPSAAQRDALQRVYSVHVYPSPANSTASRMRNLLYLFSFVVTQLLLLPRPTSHGAHAVSGAKDGRRTRLTPHQRSSSRFASLPSGPTRNRLSLFPTLVRSFKRWSVRIRHSRRVATLRFFPSRLELHKAPARYGHASLPRLLLAGPRAQFVCSGAAPWVT
jgi:hypothetical protein